jgi:hypothetical protein
VPERRRKRRTLDMASQPSCVRLLLCWAHEYRDGLIPATCRETWACCNITVKGSRHACVCGGSCSGLRRRLDAAGADGAGHSRGRGASSRRRGSRDALHTPKSGVAQLSMAPHPVGRWTCCGMQRIASSGVLHTPPLQNTPRQQRLLPRRWLGHCPQRLQLLPPQLLRYLCLRKVHLPLAQPCQTDG